MNKQVQINNDGPTPMTAQRMKVFLLTVKGVFSLTDNDVHPDYLTQALSTSVVTQEDATEFLLYAESELFHIYNKESESNYNRLNRAEKLNMVVRKFNTLCRTRSKENRDLDVKQIAESPYDKFLKTLSQKLKGSLRNMRAIRDMAAIKRETSKMVQFKPLEEIGVTREKFILLYGALTKILDKSYASDFDTSKEEAKTLIDAHKDLRLSKHIDIEIKIRVSKLASRVDLLSEADGKMEAIERFKYSIKEWKEVGEELKLELDSIVSFVDKNLNTDYNQMKDWASFKYIDSEGNKVPVFTSKEISAMEKMGGWDSIIKIMDQDRFEREFKKAWSISSNKTKMDKALKVKKF